VVAALRQSISEAAGASTLTASFHMWRTRQILAAQHGPDAPDVLALVSRQSPHVLGRALPQLRPQSAVPPGLSRGRNLPGPPNTIRPACRRAMCCASLVMNMRRHYRWIWDIG